MEVVNELDMSKFQRCLRNLISECDLTQKEFAKSCGISSEHLSRILSSGNTNRPSQQTMEKIASMLFHISFCSANTFADDFVLSLYQYAGYDSFYVRLAVRKYANKLNINGRISFMGDRLNYAMNKYIEGKRLNKTIREFLACFAKDNSHLDLLRIGTKRSFPDPCEPDITYTLCYVVWSAPKDEDEEYVVTTYFLLKSGILSSGKFIVMGFYDDLSDLQEYGLVPDDYDGNGMDYLCDIKVQPYDYDSTPEGRLLKTIFGDKDNPNERPLYHTDYGIGFTYTKTPSGFAVFMVKYKEFFQNDDQEKELMDELTNQMDALCREFSIEELDQLFAEYSYDGNHGTMGAAHAVLSRMTEDKFFDVRAGESVKCEDIDLDLDPVVYISEDSFCDGRGNMIQEKRDEAERFLLKYAKELHMPTFGDTIRYQCFDVDVKNNQVAIDYGDAGSEVESGETDAVSKTE